MGIRSDVGVAIKEELFAKLSTESLKFLDELFETKLRDEEGRLFHTTGIKWYRYDEHIEKFYSELEELSTDADEDDYLILEGCYDYPENDEGSAGNWYDNPWGLIRSVRVSVDFLDIT